MEVVAFTASTDFYDLPRASTDFHLQPRASINLHLPPQFWLASADLHLLPTASTERRHVFTDFRQLPPTPANSRRLPRAPIYFLKKYGLLRTCNDFEGFDDFECVSLTKRRGRRPNPVFSVTLTLTLPPNANPIPGECHAPSTASPRVFRLPETNVETT